MGGSGITSAAEVWAGVDGGGGTAVPFSLEFKGVICGGMVGSVALWVWEDGCSCAAVPSLAACGKAAGGLIVGTWVELALVDLALQIFLFGELGSSGGGSMLASTCERLVGRRVEVGGQGEELGREGEWVVGGSDDECSSIPGACNGGDSAAALRMVATSSSIAVFPVRKVCTSSLSKALSPSRSLIMAPIPWY